MKRITDSRHIRAAVDRLGLDKHFRTEGLQMEILRYEKGELMVSPLRPLTCFLFVISGKIRIYQLKEDSTIVSVVNLQQEHLLGYHEFCFESDEYTLYAEALTTVTCLVIPFQQASRDLHSDSRLLMYLLRRSLLDQVQSTQIRQRQTDLAEQVVFYMQNICEDNTLSSVNNAVDALHCSRRSLQRVLKELCDSGVLIHRKRGCYSLRSADEMPHP